MARQRVKGSEKDLSNESPLPEKNTQPVDDLFAGINESMQTTRDIAELELLRDALAFKATQVQNRVARLQELWDDEYYSDNDAPVPLELDEIPANQLRALRHQSGWTQQRIASAMEQLGFNWKRITVAEAETARRSLTLEELVGLATLFGVPIVHFLLPREGDYVTLPTFAFAEWDDPGDWEPELIPARLFRQLFVGEDVDLPEGGSKWGPAHEFALRCRVNVPRPAGDYWRSIQRLPTASEPETDEA